MRSIQAILIDLDLNGSPMGFAETSSREGRRESHTGARPQKNKSSTIERGKPLRPDELITGKKTLPRVSQSQDSFCLL